MAQSTSAGASSQLQSTGNPVLDELLQIMVSRFEVLVERGFLAEHFLERMVQSPNEVIKFIRQNRAVVAESLNKRLNPKQRPSREQLERMGIVPQGYFNYGHDVAMKTKHRRKSSAGADLAMMLKLRPNKEEIIKKGVIKKHEMEHGGYYELDDSKLSEMMNEENDYYDDDDAASDSKPWQISILSSLLFQTIAEALRKSVLDTQQQEANVLQEMIEMNHEMKSLRDALDKYFLSNDLEHSIMHEADEQMVRRKFHSIQETLLHISTRQAQIHDKLRILHSVERSMISLQNNYQIRLNALKKTETTLLGELQAHKTRRDRAIQIMHSERSHTSWAMTKLDYTVSVANDYNTKRNISESHDDVTFVRELDTFLSTLRNISEHQKQIVSEFDGQIERLEASLLGIRFDMSKVRNMTFKKIYDLHKQVQIAESLELGNRRLSVASATEIERERRHHRIKIQRQLGTLSVQVGQFDYGWFESHLSEVIDVESIMSCAKLKGFFSVYVQTAAQSIVDMELTWNNLNSDLPPIDGPAVSGVCNALYGVESVLEKIESGSYVGLTDKLAKCIRFVKKIKRAIAMERKEKDVGNEIKGSDDDEKGGVVGLAAVMRIGQGKSKKRRVKTFAVNDVMMIVARKLCVCCREEIESVEVEKMSVFAEQKTIDMFRKVLAKQKIFKQQPVSEMDAATQILKEVYGIDATEQSV